MGDNFLTELNLNVENLYTNLTVAELVEHSLRRNEGILSKDGALVVHTGKYTGRSPKDRFIVRQKSIEDKVNWGDVNVPISEEVFEKLFEKVQKYLDNKSLYVFEGAVGANEKYQLPIRVICECAYQALFANQLFIRKEGTSSHSADFTVIAAPGFKAEGIKDGINSEAFIIVNFDKKIVLIGGTQYSGEIKKSMFSIMNFILPQKGVFPMHCSANIGEKGDVAIFFGLSGTGKTTLSADPNRRLIGDDEHGWYEEGVFNFEGGCYAKAIDLDPEKEKDIYNAIKFGTILENVVLDEKRSPNYADDSLTENTRAAYPINYINNIEPSGLGGIPKTVVFLTADAFGVLPPVAKLSKEAAMYHFMSGYTSKLAGTERGIKEPQATFSACFGGPFMLMNPSVYAELLGQNMEKYNTQVYLINTGWIGGSYGVGKRINLPYTRAIVTAAIEGKLDNAHWVEHPIFKISMPTTCDGVPSEILNPINMWADKDEYYAKAIELAEKFNKNFSKFQEVPEEIKEAGPEARIEVLECAAK